MRRERKHFNGNKIYTCPVCSANEKNTLAEHFKKSHSLDDLQDAILKDKETGVSDVQLGEKYGITFRYLERLITKRKGINVSALRIEKKITTLHPKSFREETTTVWSFKSRGNWATHSGEYRGNWSP